MRGPLRIKHVKQPGECGSAFSQRIALEFCWVPSLKKRAQGMPGVVLHPQPCVQNWKTHKQSHYRSSRNIDNSLRNGVNGCFALSPVSMTF
jgi:hypothetical protein